MALLNYRWNNGTDENPIELNQSQLNNLLKLALNKQIVSDVRGHIATSSGLIAKYTKWQLEQKYEHLVIHAEETADTLSLVPVRSAINEGEQTTITVTGMTASSVKFRLQHSFRNVYGISQSAAQARIHMDGNVLIVDEPEENASWIDDVTVQAIPIYEEWSNPETIASCTVTVTAKELTGIVLTAPDVCVLGETFAADVTLIPSTNTKKNHVALDASCISDGALAVRKPTVQGLAVYTAAPAEDCSLTLTVNAYLFGDTGAVAFTDTVSGIHSMNPYIQFTITTDGTFSDISSANPKITLQKVDSEDEPIGQPIVLIGTVSDNSLVYTYGGGNVAGDGSEVYKVSIEKIRGYSLPIMDNVTPNQVVTEINATYLVITPDIYLIYTDGTEQNYNSVTQDSTIQGKTPICIKIMTADGEIYVEPTGPVQRQYASSTSFNISTVSANDTDFLGVVNTQRIENALIASGLDVSDPDVYAVAYARSKRITIANVTMIGYIPSAGEARALINNRTKIDAIKGVAFNNYDTIAPTGQMTSTNYADAGNSNFYALAASGGKRSANKNTLEYFNVLYTQI